MLRYRIAKTLDVPLKYAYRMRTDFRNDDAKIVGGHYPRHILRKRKGEFLWIRYHDGDGAMRERVRSVPFKPPNSWHDDTIGDEMETVLDCRLTPLGETRTKLTIRAKI